MSNIDKNNLHDIAKQMIIDGESFTKIMSRTNLRLKDLKRIQREEINTHF